MHALYVCPECRDEPGDDCSDYCAMRFAAELPPMGEPLPACPCCGKLVQLGTPLLPYAA
jgi:hypothetical protein